MASQVSIPVNLLRQVNNCGYFLDTSFLITKIAQQELQYHFENVNRSTAENNSSRRITSGSQANVPANPIHCCPLPIEADIFQDIDQDQALHLHQFTTLISNNSYIFFEDTE